MNHSSLAKTSPYPFGIKVEKAKGIYIYDSDGVKYLDLISGIAVSNLGHQNEKIINSIKKQVDDHLHVMVYGEYEQSIQEELAQKLCSLLPDGLDILYPVNSGTEANEAALKLAKRATGRTKIIAFKGAYHGSSHGSLSISGNEEKKYAFRPLLPDVFHIEFNNIDQLSEIDTSTACVIIEPIQGDAGVRIPSIEFMTALRKKCNDNGVLLIADEIQSGFGRSGKWFAYEHFNIQPDILTIGKAFGGGMPIGGVVSSKQLMNLFTENPKLGHITTFGGHPVVCAAALASINVLNDEKIIDHVESKGKLFESLLNHKLIKEIRRKGLLFAIEMKNSDVVQKVVEGCKENGLLSFWFLSCPESFRIAPPLIINEDEIQRSCQIIIEVMDNIS
ncbi:MAG: aspartate aminotransferase family protein [Crocinitomicaceae bacterium]|nr:aspartate aminotransferase family protein [Crocinitomicaceae bacterium]|tara:strand:- start:297 stop:1466 length:1170 start_codon:yes stop_codon:yes gene_type:complete